MQNSRQAPLAPAVRAAPATPVAPAAHGPPPPATPNSITITGADGTVRTIVLNDGAPVLAGESAPAVASQPPSTDDAEGQGVAIGISCTLLFFGIIAAYRRFKRWKKPAETPRLASDAAERLERVERGMEAIAIEIERISEGQRFVTKVLTDSRAPAIPAKP